MSPDPSDGTPHLEVDDRAMFRDIISDQCREILDRCSDIVEILDERSGFNELGEALTAYFVYDDQNRYNVILQAGEPRPLELDDEYGKVQVLTVGRDREEGEEDLIWARFTQIVETSSEELSSPEFIEGIPKMPCIIVGEDITTDE